LVDEEVEIIFGFDEEEDINVVAATSILNKLLSVTLNRSETDLITSELAMNQTNAKTCGTGQESSCRNWWSSKAVSLWDASCSCYFSAQFFQ